MKKSLITTLITLVVITSFYSQNYIGIGNGLRFNKIENIRKDYYSQVELDYNKVNYFGQLFWGREFSNKYHQELRLTYKSTSFEQIKINDGITGAYDTTAISLNSFNFSSLHSFRLLKKVPIYGLLGINLKRYSKLSGHKYGIDYYYTLTANDTTLIGKTYDFEYTNNPRLWGVGTVIGLQFKQRISKNLKLYLEAIYESDLKQLQMLEDVHVRNFQTNIGLIFQYGGVRVTDSIIKSKSNGNNSIGLGYGYRVFNDGFPKNSLTLNLYHRIARSKFYIGYGGGADIGGLSSPFYRMNITSEFRLVDNFSIELSPGLYFKDNGTGYTSDEFYVDNNFNFIINFKTFELIPNTGFRFVKNQTNFMFGCKFRLKT